MINIVIKLLSSTISVVLYTICYTSLSNIKLKINIRNIILIILEGILFLLNTKYIYITGTVSTVLCTIVTLTLIFHFMFKENLFKILVKVITICSIALLYEIIFSVLLTKINIFDIESYNNNLIVKFIFTFTVLMLTYFTTKIKIISNILKKLSDGNKDKIQIILLFISIIFLVFIDIKYARKFDEYIYYTNVFLIICFATIISISIYSNNKAKKEMEKIDTLLNFMKRYEKTIDDDRINRHEMLNNLLVLKSFKDRNTNDFDDTLNDFIDMYNNKSINPIRNIYKLPSGLKGIIYYKMKDAEMVSVKFDANISSKISSKLKKINNKDYTRLCKIVGIILDNAIEAAKISEKKLVVLEAYINKDQVIISISNTCKNKVNMNRINEKNYSSKGRNRGLGLYVVSNLLKNNKHLEMKQIYNNYIFTTEIIIR